MNLGAKINFVMILHFGQFNKEINIYNKKLKNLNINI